MIVECWVISASQVLFHWLRCLFLHCTMLGFITSALQHNFKSEMVTQLTKFLLFWINLALLGLLWFRMYLGLVSNFYCGILVRIALNMWIAFGKIDIFTILVLPVHKHRSSLKKNLFQFLFLVYYSFHCTGIFFSFSQLNLFQGSLRQIWMRLFH